MITVRPQFAFTIIALSVAIALPAALCAQTDMVTKASRNTAQAVDSTFNAATDPIDGAGDIAGNILIDGNRYALKSTMGLLGRGIYFATMPGNYIADKVYGINEQFNPATKPPKLRLGPSAANEPLVLMAVAGGGSRAAYYHASVMEELSKVPDPWGKKASLLDRVDVISGVSGGSWSSAWYCVNFAKRNDPDFFKNFKAAMGSNMEFRGISRMLLYPPDTLKTLTTSRTRTDVMASALGNSLRSGSPVTFGDLQREWQTAPDGAKPPVLITNGTVLNNGQRLVMTNLPREQMPAAVNRDTARRIHGGHDEGYINHMNKPLTFEDIGSDIGAFKVGDSVAASAAYPLILPPYNLKLYHDAIPADSTLDPDTRRSKWLQITDGGVYSNDGLDSLCSIIAGQPKSRPIFIIFVYTRSLNVSYTERTKTWFIPQLIDRQIAMSNQHLRFFQFLNLTGFTNPNKIAFVSMQLHGQTPAENKKLGKIPTSFNISYLNQRLINNATPNVVAQYAPMFPEVRKMFNGQITPTQYMKKMNEIEYAADIKVRD